MNDSIKPFSWEEGNFDDLPPEKLVLLRERANEQIWDATTGRMFPDLKGKYKEGKYREVIANTEKDAWIIQETFAGKPHGWIQWKGTDVCMDVHCKCGESTHVDDEFVYHVKCSKCGRVYFCNGHIELIELKETPENCVVESVG